MVLPAEAMILWRLGRYEEAREIVQKGRSLLLIHSAKQAKDLRNSNLAAGIVLQEAMIELGLGHLEAALKLGLEASEATVSDPARVLVSAVLTIQGRFKEALAALVYESSRFSHFLDEKGLELLAEDKAFQEIARQNDEEIAGVFGPSIALGRALVFLEAGDTENLGLALESAQNKLKSHRGIEHVFVRMRACWHAMKGDATSAEADLARARQLAAEKPASRSAKYETHLAAGRVFFLLGQHAKAIEELNAASHVVLHPSETHVTLYWLARSNEAVDHTLAMAQFKTLIADRFGTWMEADARNRLGGL